MLRLPLYRVERAAEAPVEASALAIAILGAGFLVDERRGRLAVMRRSGRDRAVIRLPRSRAIGRGVLAIRATDRDLVLGLMTAMSAALGTLRLHTPELGEVVVSAPSDDAAPDTQRLWEAVQRPRVVSHYALGERRLPRGRRR